MERLGYIKREISASNRRQVMVCITAEGARVRQLTRKALARADKELGAFISDADLAYLGRLIDQLRVVEVLGEATSD